MDIGQTQHRMASETGTKSVSGSSPGYGSVSTATATLYYRSFTDKETGAVATEPEIYYSTAATGNVVTAYDSRGDFGWSVNIAENEYATQSESILIRNALFAH